MKNPQPRAQRPAQTMRYIVGEDPGARGTRGDEIDQSWNGPISLAIRGRVKKTKFSRMSKGGIGGMPESSKALLTRRDSTSPRPR
jgi:hypothetical protein